MRILAFMNAFTQGASGGDMLFIKLMLELKPSKLYIVTSLNGKKLCESHGLKAIYLISTHEEYFDNAILVYLSRILNALLHITYPKDIDLVYSSSDALPDTLPAFYVSFSKNLPWLARTYHQIPFGRIISRLSQELSFLLIKGKASALVTTNSNLLSNLIKSGFPKNKLHINFPGIESNKQKISKSHTYDAVWVARIHPSKGIEDIIEIWSEVVKKNPNATLAVIGSGEQKYVDKLKNNIKIHDLQQLITFKGFLTDEDVLAHITSNKMLVHTSQEEGFGLVIAEALSCRTPVIAYDLPIYKEIFKSSISTVPVKDIYRFSEYVSDHIQNPTKYKEQTEKGYSLVKNFTWKKSSQREKQIIDEITKTNI